MTKLEHDALKIGEVMPVRYQYLGRKTVQQGFKGANGKMHLHVPGQSWSKKVSYKSVDLIK